MSKLSCFKFEWYGAFSHQCWLIFDTHQKGIAGQYILWWKKSVLPNHGLPESFKETKQTAGKYLDKMMVWINWGQQNPNCLTKKVSTPNTSGLYKVDWTRAGWTTRSQPSDQSCWSNHQLKLQIRDLTQLILQGIVAGLHTPDYVCEISYRYPTCQTPSQVLKLFYWDDIPSFASWGSIPRWLWLQCWMVLCNAVQPIQSTCWNSPISVC